MKIFTSRVSMILVIALLLASVIILIGERTQDNKLKMTDYEFSLTFGPNGRSSINTFTNTITKDLISDGVAVTDYVISDSNRNKIKRMLMNMDILSYPKLLDIRQYDDHVEIINLQIVIDGSEHSVMWTVPWDFNFEEGDRLSDLHKDFIEFVDFVKEMVIDSNEYKSLPKASGGYL